MRLPMRRVALFALIALALPPAGAALAQSPTTKIVNAANAFLATLSPRQRDSVIFAFDDKDQRVRWSNFPTGIVQRAGMKLGDLSPVQRDAAMKLLSFALSARGFEKVQQIMEGDEVLKATDTGRGGGPPGNGPPGGGNPNGPPRGAPPGGGPPGGGPPGARGPGGRGGPPGALLFGKDLYFISFMGKPSVTEPWMLQFGGHHLAINLTIAGERGILTPTLTGAQPALYTLNGKTVRPLGQESDKALALLNSLDEAQKKKAILSFRMADLVLGPGQDGKTIQPEGLKASAMTDRQRAMLLDIIAEWSSIVHESAAAARMAQLKAEINDTWFAWSGPVTGEQGKNISAYYRVQGPHLVIEYAPQGLGGDASNHVHTMYRDPTNDYGRAVTGK
jgi:Protein of unknown function (DUF3500)